MFLVPAGVFIAGTIQSQGQILPQTSYLWLAIIAMILIAAATFTYNGYCDREIDRRKGSPFAADHPRIALLFPIALYAISLILSADLGLKLFLTILFFSAATLAYSAYLTKVLVVKNVAAAAISASFILGGGWISEGISHQHWLWALIIFLAILAMEIIKDAEDREADRGFRRTLAASWSWRAIRWLVFSLIIMAVVISLFLPSHSGIFDFFWILTALAFLAGWLILPTDFNLGKVRLSRRIIYAGLWFGLGMLIAGL